MTSTLCGDNGRQGSSFSLHHPLLSTVSPKAEHFYWRMGSELIDFVSALNPRPPQPSVGQMPFSELLTGLHNLSCVTQFGANAFETPHSTNKYSEFLFHMVKTALW
jgi:hypothetical protein